MASELTRDQKSIILYVEARCVDHDGLLRGEQMNSDDHANLKAFQESGHLTYGRVPAMMLPQLRGQTHWATLNDAGWELAHSLRKERGGRIVGPHRGEVDEWVGQRNARAAQNVGGANPSCTWTRYQDFPPEPDFWKTSCGTSYPITAADVVCPMCQGTVGVIREIVEAPAPGAPEVG